MCEGCGVEGVGIEEEMWDRTDDPEWGEEDIQQVLWDNERDEALLMMEDGE